MMDDTNHIQLPSIASLMSPPEAKPLDIRQPSSKSPATPSKADYSPSIMPSHARLAHDKLKPLPSPPISPATEKQDTPESLISRGHKRKASDLRDPPLYADSDAGSYSEESLFPEPVPAVNTEELITRHMNAHMAHFKNKLNQPTRDEYRLAVTFAANISSHYNRDPIAYWRRQQEEQANEYWQTKRICADAGVRATKPSRKNDHHLAIAPAPKAGKRAIKPSTPKPSAPRHKRTPPVAKLMNFPPKGRSATPDGKSPVIKTNDVDFEALPDYTPPLSSLPANSPHIFKPEWPSTNMLDLSNDPHRHLLHEAELHLAAKLRLSCAKYLCCKRRLFMARLSALRIGKEFRKTDAQQSCAVDVNKASRLWTAYERVGWLDARFVEKFF